MKTLQLTKGQVALLDDDDYEEQSRYKWHARWNAATRSYYVSRTGHAEGKPVYLAREIMKTPAGMQCDHINHDTLDNRKENLRNVTQSQNNMNRRAQTNNKLGVKNISRNRNAFRVQVRVNTIRVYDKCFHTLSSAISARDEALKKYHGEFYQTGNIPETAPVETK